MTPQELIRLNRGAAIELDNLVAVPYTATLGGFAVETRLHSAPAMATSPNANSLSVAIAPAGRTNCVYVQQLTDGISLGKLTGNEGFFVTDNLGGCDFTILKDDHGRWAGAHVYSSQACRDAAAAPPAGWRHVYTWRSRPYAERFGNEAIVEFQRTGNMRIASIWCFAFVNADSLRFYMVKIGGAPQAVQQVTLSAQVRLE